MTPMPIGRTPSRRRGYGLIEVAVSSLLIVAAVGIVVQTVGWLATERRGAERRERATQEAANLMERLAARPWDELTPEVARSVTLTPGARAILPNGTVNVAITPASGDPSARRLAIEVGWGDRAGGATGTPVRLVAWAHRRGGSKP